MRIVLDTNVLVSGVFFGGLPARILRAWRDGDIQLVLSAEILEEYQRVGHLLAGRYSGVDLEPFLALLAVHAELVRAPALPRLVCADPDDDSSSPARMAGGVGVIVSGDEDLLEQSGWNGIRVLRPRQFTDEFLPET